MPPKKAAPKPKAKAKAAPNPRRDDQLQRALAAIPTGFGPVPDNFENINATWPAGVPQWQASA